MKKKKYKSHAIFLVKVKTVLPKSDNEQLWVDTRDGSGVAVTSVMEFFVEIANGFQPLTNVPASSVLELQYVPGPPQDAQGLMKRLIIFLQALFSKKKVSATMSIYCYLYYFICL